MNLCGSFGGGGAACEVDLNRCLLVGIDFCGSIMVDLGLGFYKYKKKKKNGRERGMGGQNSCRGEMKSQCVFLKESKFLHAT